MVLGVNSEHCDARQTLSDTPGRLKTGLLRSRMAEKLPRSFNKESRIQKATLQCRAGCSECLGGVCSFQLYGGSWGPLRIGTHGLQLGIWFVCCKVERNRSGGFMGQAGRLSVKDMACSRESQHGSWNHGGPAHHRLWA